MNLPEVILLVLVALAGVRLWFRFGRGQQGRAGLPAQIGRTARGPRRCRG
jgi:hypothetical protein